jgi:uncharacterized surface protein with fasciclin (FAS1) repeats
MASERFERFVCYAGVAATVGNIEAMTSVHGGSDLRLPRGSQLPFGAHVESLKESRMTCRISLALLLLGTVVGLSSVCSTAAADPAGTKDIVDTAVAAGSFKTLAAALKAGELIDALKSKGPFTVFAPTDEAFAQLPPGTVETLLKPENREKLVAVLEYHVVSGKVMSDQVVKLNKATTLNGKDVRIDAASGVKVNGATVVKADIMASNGVIHVIDRVLLPE